MKTKTTFHAELIDRFLNQLDFWERKALGDKPEIEVSYVEGDPEETLSISLSPFTPILHVELSKSVEEGMEFLRNIGVSIE